MRDARAALRRKMVTDGLSLRDVADQVTPRVSHEALRQWLDGAPVGWKVATALAGYLGCEPALLARRPRGRAA